MRGIRLILATIVVIGAINFGVEGLPKPQGFNDDSDEVFMVDGFAFDGPFSRATRRPNIPPTLLVNTPVAPVTNRPNIPPTLLADISIPPVFIPEFPTQTPVVETTSSTTTPSPTAPTAPPTFGPGFAAQPQGFIAMTPAPEPLRPEVARCAANCQFQVTLQFNPVCGDDGVIYTNSGLLNCVRNCGSNVQLAHVGRCSSNSRG